MHEKGGDEEARVKVSVKVGQKQVEVGDAGMTVRVSAFHALCC